jgi:hypothetical protein
MIWTIQNVEGDQDDKARVLRKVEPRGLGKMASTSKGCCCGP